MLKTHIIQAPELPTLMQISSAAWCAVCFLLDLIIFIIHVFALVCEADISRCRKELDASIQDMSEGYNISHFCTMGKNEQTCARYLFPGQVLFYTTTSIAVSRRGKPNFNRDRRRNSGSDLLLFVHLVTSHWKDAALSLMTYSYRCYTVSPVTIQLFCWVQVHKFAA